VLGQKYTILQSTLATNLHDKADEDLSAVDNIAVIFSALCNCCDSVVLF